MTSVSTLLADAALPTSEPILRPLMVQRWADVVFLHWAYDPVVVQRLLPAGVTVDTLHGSAWVGLVPFHMEGLGFPGLAPLPLVGTFPEVNVRTYVRAGGRRAVWFFSLDVDRLVPMVVARHLYHLNYCAGRVTHQRSGNIITSRVERRWPRSSVQQHVMRQLPTGAEQEAPMSKARPAVSLARRLARSSVRATTSIDVATGPAIDPADELAQFLTARWGLVSAARRGGLRHARVDHAPWPLHQAEVLHLDDRLLVAAGLPAPTAPAHVMWSPGVDVRIGRPRRVLRNYSD